MTFNANTPLPDDILSDSQVDLNNNNKANNVWSGVDHYSLTSSAPNNGFHMHVTSPTPAVVPPAAAPVHYDNPGLNPILYGMNDTFTNANPNVIGNLQYSRGPNNAVPSPLTTLQSSSAALSGDTITVRDFNGVPYCYGKITVAGTSNGVNFIVLGAFFWPGSGNGSASYVAFQGAGVAIAFSGSLLNIVGNFATITKAAWTLSFDRIWTPT